MGNKTLRPTFIKVYHLRGFTILFLLITNSDFLNASARGGKDGAVVRALASHQCGRGSNPGVDAICECEFVVGSLPCSERFPVFPSPQKPLL